MAGGASVILGEASNPDERRVDAVVNGILLVLGAATAVYGAAMAALYPAGGFFVLWFLLAAGLLGVWWARRTGAWQRAAAWVRRAVCGMAVAALLAGGAGCMIIFSAAAPSTWGTTPLDYLIVLGAGLNEDGTPSETLAYRLDKALNYLSEPGHEKTRCVVTGGQGGDEPRTEASSMAVYLREHGIAPDRIILEERATSTVENLRFSRELVPEGTMVGLITSDFHLYRAERIARHEGFPSVVGMPAPVNPLYQPHNVLRECLVLAKDAVLGNL